MEEYSNDATGLEGLIGPSGYCYRCSYSSGSPQSIRIKLQELEDQSGCLQHLHRGSESNRLEEESFILKDTPVDPDRNRNTWS